MDNSRSITSASINDLKCERLKDTKYLHFTSLSYPIKGEESITVKENMKLKQSLQHRPVNNYSRWFSGNHSHTIKVANWTDAEEEGNGIVFLFLLYSQR